MKTSSAVLEEDTKSSRLASDLFDTSPGYDEEVGVRLPSTLSPEDAYRAKLLNNEFKG